MTLTHTHTQTAGETAHAGATAAANDESINSLDWKVETWEYRKIGESTDEIDHSRTEHVVINNKVRICGLNHAPKGEPSPFAPSFERGLANARLIAAAPSMLRELKSAFAAIDALIYEKPMMAAKLCGWTTLGNTRAEIKAVIAKAEQGDM